MKNSKKLAAMIAAQKKSRMKKGMYLKPLSSTQKVVYVAPLCDTIAKPKQEEENEQEEEND